MLGSIERNTERNKGKHQDCIVLLLCESIMREHNNNNNNSNNYNNYNNNSLGES